MYENRFQNEKHTLLGYCPHCNESVLNNYNNVKVNDDYLHMECYENYKELLEEE